jgi:Type III restriction enzyme, res subunit
MPLNIPTMPSLTIAADCLLEDIPFVLEKAVMDQLTIDNPKYVSAKKYGRWIGKQLQPKLKFYESVPGGLRFPRGFANQAVLLCRKVLGVTPNIHDERQLLAEVDFSFVGTLRPYQKAALAAAAKRSLGVLESGTGSGKTVMALAVIAARRQPTLIVVHTKELLYQ